MAKELARLREQLVRSVVVGARQLARHRIDAEFGAQRDEVTATLPPGAERDRRLAELRARYDDEIARVDSAAPGRAWEEAVTQIEEGLVAADGRLRELFVIDLQRRTTELRRANQTATAEETLTTDVQRLQAMSTEELRQWYLGKVEADFLRALGGGKDTVTPGSAGHTSDIDRSWSSEHLRRAARDLLRAEVFAGRAGSSAPTLARALDVNEYLGVMERIGKMLDRRGEYADRPAGEVVVGKTTVRLSNADMTEAHAIAAAMDPQPASKRESFARNLIESAAAISSDEQARVTALVQVAAASLKASEGELAAELRRQEAQGFDPSDPDTEIRARDELYGRRAKRLVEIEQAIDAAPEGSEGRADLMAAWEAEMNIALRDGIETYSDMATLDIVVTRAQGAGGGTPRPIGDLIRDPAFLVEMERNLTPAQLRAVHFDQVFKLMHHVGQFHAGHESPAAAARALAKYAQRGLLVAAAQGSYDPHKPGGPYDELAGVTTTLMDAKGDPAKMVRALIAFERFRRCRRWRSPVPRPDRVAPWPGRPHPAAAGRHAAAVEEHGRFARMAPSASRGRGGRWRGVRRARRGRADRDRAGARRDRARACPHRASRGALQLGRLGARHLPRARPGPGTGQVAGARAPGSVRGSAGWADDGRAPA